MLRKLCVMTSLVMMSLSSTALAYGRDREFYDGYNRHEYYQNEHRGHPWNCPPQRNYNGGGYNNGGGYYTESYSTWQPSYERVYNVYPQQVYAPPPVYNVYPQPRVIYHYPVQPRPSVVFQLGF